MWHVNRLDGCLRLCQLSRVEMPFCFPDLFCCWVNIAVDGGWSAALSAAQRSALLYQSFVARKVSVVRHSDDSTHMQRHKRQAPLGGQVWYGSAGVACGNLLGWTMKTVAAHGRQPPCVDSFYSDEQ
jgi:hypothetical protein